VPAQPLAITAALLAGLAGGMQIAVNGVFGRRIGFLEAACFASVVTVLTLVTATLVVRHGLGGVADGLSLPPWLWLGGLGSAVLVLSVTFASPRIGGLATGGLLIAGQLCILLCTDTFGWFGLQKVPLSAHRLVGLPLLAVAAFLILKR
jgi:bacterial/archaeal transporter family-2 protein